MEKDGKSQKTAARAAQWGGGAEMGPMGLMGLMRLMRLMGCDKRVWAMREQRRGGEAVLFPGVL